MAMGIGLIVYRSFMQHGHNFAVQQLNIDNMGLITSNDFLNSVLEPEAWEEVSQSEILSMSMLERFADKLDWEEVSGNYNVIWTVEGISKYAGKIN